MYIEIVEPTFPEDFIRAVMTVKRLRLITLSQLLRMGRSNLSNMLNGRINMPAATFDEICYILELDATKIRKNWYLHFDSSGNLPARGFRAFSEKAAEAYRIVIREREEG